MRDKVVKVVLLFLIVAIFAETFFLLFYPKFVSQKGLSFQTFPLIVFLKDRKEMLIGDNCVGLSKSKAEGLLKLSENKGKFVLPVFAEPDTKIISLPYDGNKFFLSIENIKDRIIFSPVISGVKFETVMAGEEALVYYTMKENGFIISILNPQNEGSVKVINPEEEDKVPFGTILAKGFKDRLGRDGGKASVVVFLSFQPIGNNPMDYLLKYKGRIVTLIKE